MTISPQYKPKCKIIGTNGNIYALSGRVVRALRGAGLYNKAEEFTKEIFEQRNYGEALDLIRKYVDVY